jgi:hypothetical protein
LARIGGAAVGRVDHRAPLRETRALLVILGQPLIEPVEALGDEVAAGPGEFARAFVHLDAGDRAGVLDQLHQRRAVLGVLPDGLVIEDDAGDVAHRLLGPEHQLAIVAAVVFGVFDADGVEALLDSAGGFVGRQNALAGRHHSMCYFVQFVEIHRPLPSHGVIVREGGRSSNPGISSRHCGVYWMSRLRGA